MKHLLKVFTFKNLYCLKNKRQILVITITNNIRNVFNFNPCYVFTRKQVFS